MKQVQQDNAGAPLDWIELVAAAKQALPDITGAGDWAAEGIAQLGKYNPDFLTTEAQRLALVNLLHAANLYEQYVLRNIVQRAAPSKEGEAELIGLLSRVAEHHIAVNDLLVICGTLPREVNVHFPKACYWWTQADTHLREAYQYQEGLREPDDAEELTAQPLNEN